MSSRSEARKVKRSPGSGGRAVEDTEIRNFAAIRYEFTANGRVMRGDRISMADDLGNFEVAEKLQRYPVGAAVTVFHDRNRPQDCVLERSLATRPFAIAVVVGTLFGACLLLLIAIGSGAVGALGELGPAPAGSSAAIFAAVLGLLLVAFALGLNWRGAPTFAWPKTTGTIVSSDADAVRVRFRRRHAMGARRNHVQITHDLCLPRGGCGLSERPDQFRCAELCQLSPARQARRGALRRRRAGRCLL